MNPHFCPCGKPLKLPQCCGRRLHERSRFVRDNGRWYYLDGDMP